MESHGIDQDHQGHQREEWCRQTFQNVLVANGKTVTRQKEPVKNQKVDQRET